METAFLLIFSPPLSNQTTPGFPFSHSQEAPTTKAAALAKDSTATAAPAAEDERVPAKAAAAKPADAADAAADAAPLKQKKPQQAEQKQKPVRLCVYGATVDAAACDAAVAAALSPAAFSCVAEPSAQACAAAVASGDADVIAAQRYRFRFGLGVVARVSSSPTLYSKVRKYCTVPSYTL